MTLPGLREATVRAYLSRLGNPVVSLDLEGLSRLQRAHLRALPFHNLEPLASEEDERGPLPIEAAVEGNIAGLGGTWHQLTPPFVTLLRALGFDAWIAESFVGVVRLPEGCFAIDVGYRHPYLTPFPLEASPPGFTPEPRPYASFEKFLREQEALAGPDPCLDSVRAIRMSGWALVTVRNALYQRFAGGLTTSRPVSDWDAVAELLRTLFGLPEELCARALLRLRRRIPNLLGRVGRPRACLRFILSVAVTDRLEGVSDLLRSAANALDREQRSGVSVGVLIVDNGRTGRGENALDAVLEDTRRRGLQVTRVEARNELGRLAPFQRCGLLPTALSVPLPIGASRTLQASLLQEHLRTGALGLPYPGDDGGPVAVWMLDDDLSFRRLCTTPDGFDVDPVGDCFSLAESFWTNHPEVSVVLGTFTGDPPIPGYATLHVQTQDLAGNLRSMEALPPDATWTPGALPRELTDYYYDHARGPAAHLQAIFPWTPPGRAPWRVREAFQTLCSAFTLVPLGRQVTRPLTHAPSRTLVPSRNRGGNALFLDLDALVAAPYPVMRGEDGVLTRRADTLWAHLLAREPLCHVVQADLDLMHGRRVGDGHSPLAERQPDPAALRAFVEAQERGVVLARLLEHGVSMETTDAEREVSVRRSLLARSREGVRQAASEARRVLSQSDAWWWREEEAAMSARACLEALARVEILSNAVDALDDPSLPAQLASFSRHVLAALLDWWSTWD